MNRFKKIKQFFVANKNQIGYNEHNWSQWRIMSFSREGGNQPYVTGYEACAGTVTEKFAAQEAADQNHNQ